MYLHSFAEELLAGKPTLSSIFSPELDTDLLILTELCSKIEEVNVSVSDRKLRISLILPTGHQIDPPDPFFHNLYRVTLKNGETWAVDTTGAQYGYADPLCPWRDFEQHRSGKINSEYEFGYIRHQVYQSYGMFPARHVVA